MTKLEVIEARMRKLQAQAQALAAKESAKAIATIRQLMAEHGLTTADIRGHVGKTRTAKRSAGTVKYRDPRTGATWTGHGRAPGWIASVKDRTKYLASAVVISDNSPVSNGRRTISEGKKSSLRPIYRDPKTGAQWSGRGRAPGWIASAKDRTKFLVHN